MDFFGGDGDRAVTVGPAALEDVAHPVGPLPVLQIGQPLGQVLGNQAHVLDGLLVEAQVLEICHGFLVLGRIICFEDLLADHVDLVKGPDHGKFVVL